VLLAVGLVAGVSMLGQAGATFGLATRTSATLTGTTLDQYLPTEATAVRTSATTCRVGWTAATDAPAGLSYDLTDGAGGTLVTREAGPSTLLTVPVTAIAPTLRARLQSWISPGERAVTAPCLGWPDAPGGLHVVDGDQQLDLSWTAPAGNGGTVASYTVRVQPGGQTCTATAPATGCTVTGLTNGQAYSVSVVAISEVGGSPPATGTGTPSDHLPGAPSSVSVDPADGRLQVGWSAPESDGGSPVTGYTATAVPAEAGLPTRSCSAGSSPCPITGLTDGVDYQVTVSAQNAHGTGEASVGLGSIPYPTGILAGSRLALWLDGADPDSLFGDVDCRSPVVGAGPLGCWADRSGHGPGAGPAGAGHGGRPEGA
jgi:hypothetical protein